MKTGSRGLALIKQFEGLRLDAYRDSVGVWTIGFGHTAAAGDPKPCAGMRITKGEADAILARDLGRFETVVLAAITRPATQDQFDAMVSLCFNIGPGNFAKSNVVRAFNLGEDRRAAQAFLAWHKAGGKVLAGLARRRQAEKRLFQSKAATPPAKWVIAGAGGTIGGTIAAGAADSFVSSLGFGLSSSLDWRGLLVIGGIIGVAAMATLWAIGGARRERLWDRVFG